MHAELHAKVFCLTCSTCLITTDASHRYLTIVLLVSQVSDEGGGIARSGLPKIWTYLYSTALSPLDDMEDSGDADGPAVLAGYGYGLPLSRLYARYFGGDLQIISMEGYGTDAYLHLNRLGNVQEPLP